MKGIKHVPITEDHVHNGRERDGWACPIALALKDAGYGRVYAGRECVELYPFPHPRGERPSARLRTSRQIKEFMNHFDEYGDYDFGAVYSNGTLVLDFDEGTIKAGAEVTA